MGWKAILWTDSRKKYRNDSGKIPNREAINDK